MDLLTINRIRVIKIKYILITVNIIRRSSDHAVVSWTYNKYKSIIVLETYDILIETHNIIGFERLPKYFDTIFDYTSKVGPKLNLLNITII